MYVQVHLPSFICEHNWIQETGIYDSKHVDIQNGVGTPIKPISSQLVWHIWNNSTSIAVYNHKVLLLFSWRNAVMWITAIEKLNTMQLLLLAHQTVSQSSWCKCAFQINLGCSNEKLWKTVASSSECGLQLPFAHTDRYCEEVIVSDSSRVEECGWFSPSRSFSLSRCVCFLSVISYSFFSLFL